MPITTTDARHTIVTFPEHAARVVATEVIDGITVEIVQNVEVSLDAVDGEPVVEALDKFDAVEAGTYTVSAPEVSFYRTEQSYHRGGEQVVYGKVGAVAGTRPSYTRGQVLADRTKSIQAAFTGAKRSIARRRHFERFGPTALRVTRTLTIEQLHELPLIDATVAVGDVVAAPGLFNRNRVGVVTKVGPKNVTIMYATPTGAQPMEKAISRDRVGQVSKAAPAEAPEAGEPEAGEPAMRPNAGLTAAEISEDERIAGLPLEEAAAAIGVCLHLTSWQADGEQVSCRDCGGGFASRQALDLAFGWARARVWAWQAMLRWRNAEPADGLRLHKVWAEADDEARAYHRAFEQVSKAAAEAPAGKPVPAARPVAHNGDVLCPTCGGVGAASCICPATEAPAEVVGAAPATPLWQLDLESAAKALGVCLHLTTFEPAGSDRIYCDCGDVFLSRRVLNLAFRVQRARVWLVRVEVQMAAERRPELVEQVADRRAEVDRLSAELGLPALETVL